MGVWSLCASVCLRGLRLCENTNRARASAKRLRVVRMVIPLGISQARAQICALLKNQATELRYLRLAAATVAFVRQLSYARKMRTTTMRPVHAPLDAQSDDCVFRAYLWLMFYVYLLCTFAEASDTLTQVGMCFCSLYIVQ